MLIGGALSTTELRNAYYFLPTLAVLGGKIPIDEAELPDVSLH